MILRRQKKINDNVYLFQQITAPKDAFRKTWSAKYTLRSHFDGVRALGFHPSEPVLITASEDQTLKLWNLQKTIPAKKSAALDVEPVYTFRAHTGPVLSLAIASSGDLCFSGGIDNTIRVWSMPSPNVDPYDSYGKFVFFKRRIRTGFYALIFKSLFWITYELGSNLDFSIF